MKEAKRRVHFQAVRYT